MKRNYKLLIGFIIGIFIVTVVYADVVVNGNNISYTDNYSLGSTNIQNAIDKTYTNVVSSLNNCPNYTYNNSNFIKGYSYNESGSNLCITGNESTCVETTCYKKGKCKAGDIIDYKVNDSETIRFHVMFDDCGTLTMQSQKNIVYNIQWYTEQNTNSGPLTILSALNNSTETWHNVNDITYDAGTTVFKTNKFTGCNAYNSCTKNKYTLNVQTAKARMISVQEANILGCDSSKCPKWFYYFIRDWYGDDSNWGYWTMSSHTSYECAWTIRYDGRICDDVNITSNGARAVVQVSK